MRLLSLTQLRYSAEKPEPIYHAYEQVDRRGLVNAASVAHDQCVSKLVIRTQARLASRANALDISLAPGIAVAVALGLAARWLGGALGTSTLTVAVICGMALSNAGLPIDRLRPGLTFAGKHILRVGVIALGMRLSIDSVSQLGAGVILTIVATVTATFFGTQLLGRRLGVSRPLSLLIATGYSICGASAIAAAEVSTEAEEEEVALAIGLVTLFGTVAIVAIPPLAGLLALEDEAFGTWAGASVHDVAQVVATGAQGGSAVLAVAVVVKLCRVILLAPIVAGVNVARRRQVLAASSEAGGTATGAAPPLVPGFVMGFLAMMLLRTSGVVPDSVIDWVRVVEGLMFAAALVGLGTGVNLARFRQLGARPFVLGLVAWVVVAAVSLAAITILL